MTAWLLLALVAAAPDAGVPKDAPRAPHLAAPRGPEGATRCAACHGTSSWTDVRFNHERTGFSLTGRHARTTCKACHVKDFTTPLARACAGCHTDVHAGELGARCDGCHDTTDWRSRVDVDAHRRTNFPLLGAHAMVPCVECHLEARERRFSRAAVDCAACHQGAVARTRGTAVDHPALGFDLLGCRECHGAVSFRPARFPQHDVCFSISAGPHARVTCQGCHTSLAAGSTSGRCATMTAACTACHEHRCSLAGEATETDRRHAGVPGYQCQSRKCYECHRTGEELP